MPRYYRQCPHCQMPAMVVTGCQATGRSIPVKCIRCTARFVIDIGPESAKPLPVEKPKRDYRTDATILARKEKAKQGPPRPPPVAPIPRRIDLIPMVIGDPCINMDKLGKVDPRVNYVAADRDGRVFGYEYEPEQCDGFWGAGPTPGQRYGTDGFVEPLPAVYIDPFCLWWKRSLLYRKGFVPTKQHALDVDKEPEWSADAMPDDVHQRMKRSRQHQHEDEEEECE